MIKKTFILLLTLATITTSAFANDQNATLTFNTGMGWNNQTLKAYTTDLEKKYSTNIETYYKDWGITLRVKIYVDGPPATAIRIANYIKDFIDSGLGEWSVGLYQRNKNQIEPFKDIE